MKIKRKVSLGVLGFLILASAVLAQGPAGVTGRRVVAALDGTSTPRVEVFGGYEYFRLNVAGFHANFNGWHGGITGNLSSTVGITADVSGIYTTQSGVGAHVYSYLFGPTIYPIKHHRVTPYAQTLFGVSQGTISGLGTQTKFATALGGGVEVDVSKHFGVRGGMDWLRTSFLSELALPAQNNARAVAGVVFRF